MYDMIWYNDIIMIFGTVSAKIAPRFKCYNNASRLNRYNFPTDNAIDFLFATFIVKWYTFVWSVHTLIACIHVCTCLHVHVCTTN